MSPDVDPPETRREVVTETHHGTEIPDPYRWLEKESDEVADWTSAQTEYAEALLNTETRERLRPRLEALAEVSEYGAIQVRGGRYFQTIERPADDHPRLLVREAPDSDGTVLVDPNTWPANEDHGTPTQSMGWFQPAHDGSAVAYGVTEGGDEQYDIHVVAVPDGAEVAVREDCGRTNPMMLAWDGDCEGVFYVATGAAGGGDQLSKAIRHWRFVGAEETLGTHDDPRIWPVLTADRDSGTLAVGFSEMVGGTDWHVRVADELRPVIESDAETDVRFHDGTAFLLTDHEAPRKRLLACSLEQFRAGDLAFEDCRELRPDREGVLAGFVPTPNHLTVHYREDARSRLAVFDRDGTHCRDLSLPASVTVDQLTGNPDADEVFFQVSGFDRPPVVRCADPGTGDRGSIQAVAVDAPDTLDVPADLVVEQALVESTDGADVPVFVCHRSDIDLDGDNPALLYGYGGFRNSVTPEFDRFRLPFLADGGVYAQVSARGGLEYGEPWHEAGMLADKPHTFDDFVAAGEYLCEAGYTNPDRLGVAGGSNGGLSVGAVVTRRPDLWGAAVCTVPLLDMLRFHRFLLGESWTTEYGHPEDPQEFETLREYSPYHNVDSGVSYPPVLSTTAVGDTRVHPAHARKMTARLQTEASGGPFVLRTREDTGHGVGKPTSMVLDEQTDEWTFLSDHLGVAVAGRE